MDRLENSGPRELATIKMRSSGEAGEHVIFAINADIAKAHRRVKVRAADWGVQACKVLILQGSLGIQNRDLWGLVGSILVEPVGGPVRTPRYQSFGKIVDLHPDLRG